MATPAPLSVRPSKLHIPGLGTFKLAGEDNRQVRWVADRVPSNRGEFVSTRQVRLSNPSAGLIGEHRHSGTMAPAAGIADAVDADTSQDGIIGAGPLVTEIALTASGASTSETQDPATGADNSAYGANAWTSPTNILSSNDTRATVATSGLSHYLKATDFGFSVTGTIKGIELLLERSKTVDAANTGATSGTTANMASVGTNAWTSPTNAQSSNNTYATCATNGQTQGLRLHTLGFSVPTTANILGVLVEIERKATTATGTPTQDSVATGYGSGSGTTLTWSHALGSGTNRLLMAHVSTANFGVTTTGVTFNGDAMTLVHAEAHSQGEASLWRLIAPDTGTHDIVATFSAATSAKHSISVSYTAVDQTTPLGTANGRNGSATDPLVLSGANAVATASGNLAFGVFFSGSTNTFSAGSGETLVQSYGPNYSSAVIVESASGATVDLDPTDSASANVPYASIGVAIKGVTYSTAVDTVVNLVDASGTLFGNNLSAGAEWPDADAYATFGGATTMWGLNTTTLTPAIVNDADFGAVISATISGGGTASVDHIRITVYYEDGDVVDSVVRLVVDGIVVGTNRADTSTQWPTTDATVTYGS
jgi:hypothetical protein